VLTTHGLLVDVHAKHTPAVIDNPEAFTTLGGEARFFLSAAIPTKPTLALRAGGEKIFGRHPFYESAFIGGDRSVRGYASERFAGDASLYGSAELRLALVRYMLVVPTTLGVNLFADAGRVYLAGEESKTVHSAYGGGLWFMFIDPSLTLGISAAQSPEKLAVYVKGGFAF
jgi:outer membrane protein assembly factor BamA